MSAGKLFIISASSGAGKTSLANALIKEWSLVKPLKKVVTYTTRPPRPGEIDGIDYYFLSEAEFQQKIQESFFIEFSVAYGYYYGSPKALLCDIERGISCLLILDRQGALALRDSVKQARLIWVYTETVQVLLERLSARGSESSDQVAKRMQRALAELADQQVENHFDYSLLNTVFDDALRSLKEIVEKELSADDKK